MRPPPAPGESPNRPQEVARNVLSPNEATRREAARVLARMAIWRFLALQQENAHE
jgi:hypothetical protein